MCKCYFLSNKLHPAGNLDEVDSYTSTASILLIGYGFILMVGAAFAMLHTSYKYLRGERLVIAIFLGRLPGIFFRGIVSSIFVADIFLNLLIKVIIYPLLFGWSLDICTAKMFGTTMSQRLNPFTASSFASTALHCLIGLFLNTNPWSARPGFQRDLARWYCQLLGADFEL